MPWLQALMTGIITHNRRILCDTSHPRLMDAPRPKSVAESGADPVALNRIRGRIPGVFETLGFIGGAVAQLVEFDQLELLPDVQMEKLKTKYGDWYNRAYLAMVRTTGANAIWNCAEPSGGMAENEHLVLERLKEGLDLGLYHDDGWVRFQLPPDLAEYQDDLDREQACAWELIRPGLQPIATAEIELLNEGHDTRNGFRGIVTAGPVGDISHTIITQLRLPRTETGWRVLDAECRPGNPERGEPDWVPLRRKVVAIVPRHNQSPLMFELDPDGRLHPGGLHLAVEGENRGYVISHLSTAVLETLGWFERQPATPNHGR